MATMLEYLKTVQELETNLYIDNMICPIWQTHLNNLIQQQKSYFKKKESEHRQQVNSAKQKIVQNNAKIQQLQYQLENPEDAACKEYPMEKPQKSSMLKTFFKSFWEHFVMLLGYTCLWGFESILFFILFFCISPLCLVFSLLVGLGYAFFDMFASPIQYKSAKKIYNKNENKKQQFIKRVKAQNPTLINNLTQKAATLENEYNSLVTLCPDYLKNAPFSKEIEQAQVTVLFLSNSISQMRSQLNDLYNLNIIHEKYRTLIPVTMFYEYFETGRCITLTGHEGAYNLYEAELRQNIIIDKLDGIKDQLEDIKKNQYYLAKTLSAGFARLEAAQRAQTNRVSGAIEANTAQYTALTTSTDRLLREGISVSGTIKIET